jgi:predicted nucleic acid-binding protein
VADAFYVELAHVLGTRVLTVDARLARASSLAVLPPTD